LTAHAEMDDEDVAVVQLDQQVLAPAVDAGDLAALELGREVLLVRVTADRPHAADVDLLDPLADHLFLQVALQSLDLGQLRHRRPPPRPPPLPSSSRPWWSATARPFGPRPARPASLTDPRPYRTPRRRCRRWRGSAWRDRGPPRGRHSEAWCRGAGRRAPGD